MYLFKIQINRYVTMKFTLLGLVLLLDFTSLLNLASAAKSSPSTPKENRTLELQLLQPSFQHTISDIFRSIPLHSEVKASKMYLQLRFLTLFVCTYPCLLLEKAYNVCCSSRQFQVFLVIFLPARLIYSQFNIWAVPFHNRLTFLHPSLHCLF